MLFYLLTDKLKCCHTPRAKLLVFGYTEKACRLTFQTYALHPKPCLQQLPDVQAAHVGQLFASAADKHAAAIRSVQELAADQADSDAQWLRHTSQEVLPSPSPPSTPLHPSCHLAETAIKCKVFCKDERISCSRALQRQPG